MDSRSAETFSYLRRHYFNDAKLKRLALTEFVRAMRSGRLIAFTGSFTTVGFGYPRWSKLLHDGLDNAKRVLATHGFNTVEHERLIAKLQRMTQVDPDFDARVAFSAVEQLLDHLSSREKLTKEARAAIAEWFLKTKTTFRRDESNLAALLDGLQIDRILTTNYDLELEVQAMRLNPPRTRRPDWNIGSSIEALKDRGWLHRAGSAEEGHSLILNLANGDRIVSDTMRRDRPESLIEFAIGCPENDRHIFHLHGRADQPGDIILSYRDYDKLYRRRGPGKLPFEHARRVLFAGNPVVFIGLGMTEPEVNQTLTEFVGDQPYSRKAPAFLIWDTKAWMDTKDVKFRSTMSPKEAQSIFRLDMLHRLGILTIFSDDLPALRPAPPAPSSPGEILRSSLLRLSRYVVEAQDRRMCPIPPSRWRDALPRIRRKVPIINTWNVIWTDPPSPPLSAPRLYDRNLITVFIRPPGASKTQLADALAESWQGGRPDRKAAILNFNMRIDTDSILALISDLLRFDTTKGTAAPRTASRQAEFSADSCTGLRSGEKLLIVLKGIERIFDINGHPLSAEFDLFLRTMVAKSAKLNIRFVVIGTDRIRKYFEGLAEVNPRARIKSHQLAPHQASLEKSRYLEMLRGSFAFNELQLAKLKNRENGDFAAMRRTIYHTVLSPKSLMAKGVDQAELALEILSIMSFIGQPVEEAVLFHAPTIQRRLEDSLTRSGRRVRLEQRIRDARALFHAVFVQLQADDLRLVREINYQKVREPHQRRFAVHLSLQTEIRDRNGIPLSDSILSTAYNMSLFSAQPADGALPEADLHDALGKLVDWFVGAYRDLPLDPKFSKGNRWSPHVIAALRAAVSLVRGLYSTSALLSVDRRDRLIREGRDGLLAEHAARLERILEAFDDMWRSRQRAASRVTKIDLGAEPLYPDEVVWLHNERGVVKLAQGDLYEARFSFDEADRLNRERVEFDDPSHNWRRITLNQVVVDIERGRLQSAEDRMNKVEQTLGPAADHIRAEYLDPTKLGRIRFDTGASHEDILAMAVIVGYRGLISHLRGELGTARNNFDRAIGALQRMDEQRALALFRRHKAALYSDLGDLEGMKREARHAIAGAESVRQLDIVYAGRLLEAYAARKTGNMPEKASALSISLEALEYATMADMHRLAVDAHFALGSIKFDSADFDASLEHVSEALAIATRYGLSLYKVTLRTMMGRILIKRGNRVSGRTLIGNAINGAVRMGYQRAIESARRDLADAGE